MNFTPPVTSMPVDTRWTGIENEHGIRIGQLVYTRDGRRYRFCRTYAGLATNHVLFNAPGLLGVTFYSLATPSVIPNGESLNGGPFYLLDGPLRYGTDRYTLVWTGATLDFPVPANEYATMYAATPAVAFGGGTINRKLKGHTEIPAGVPNPTVTITLAADDQIMPGDAIVDQVFLLRPAHAGLIVAYDYAPLDDQPRIMGVSCMALPEKGMYGWFQVTGPCPMILSTPEANQIVRAGVPMTDALNHGAVRPVTDVTRQPIIGYSTSTGKGSATPNGRGEIIVVDLKIG